MIDYVKIRVFGEDARSVRENPNLEFIARINTRTGQQMDMMEAKYRGMIITAFNDKETEIAGSLHKFKNNGKHNYDDFTSQELVEVIEELCKTLDIQPENCKLVNLEAGFNITPPFELSSKEILDNLLTIKNRKVEKMNLKGISNYHTTELSQYYVKIYDKRLPYIAYMINNETLRFEIKITRHQLLKEKLGIRCLADLLVLEKLKGLNKMLIEAWEDVLFLDPTLQEHELSKKEKNKLLSWSNPNYWTKIFENHRKKARNYPYREKERFLSLTDKHSSGTHQEIKKRLLNKWDKFILYIKAKNVSPSEIDGIREYQLELGYNPDFQFNGRDRIRQGETNLGSVNKEGNNQFIDERNYWINERANLKNLFNDCVDIDECFAGFSSREKTVFLRELFGFGPILSESELIITYRGIAKDENSTDDEIIDFLVRHAMMYENPNGEYVMNPDIINLPF